MGTKDTAEGRGREARQGKRSGGAFLFMGDPVSGKYSVTIGVEKEIGTSDRFRIVLDMLRSSCLCEG